jgi:hypothetical protein
MTTTLLDLWLSATAERDALRAQLEHLQALWLRAEAEADHWYFEANNPEDARERRAAHLRWAATLGGEPLTAEFMEARARELRAEIDQRWAAEVAGRKAS